MPPFISAHQQPDSTDGENADEATWVLASTTASPCSARQQVAARLRTWGLAHLVVDAQLIVSELLTNAVCHGSERDPVWHTVRRIHTEAGHAIRLEVGDYGQGWSGAASSLDRGDDNSCGGRGLHLVEALSSSWGAWRLPHGNVVWAVLPVDACSVGPAEPSGSTEMKPSRRRNLPDLEGSFNDPYVISTRNVEPPGSALSALVKAGSPDDRQTRRTT
ncbi:ATP-binding protein [Streptomyces sp. V4I23]|uniref:ATP-binding protein n=1 Tax=Streptomyces sp. V4I23 TaxID=3042282 RepID=UPI0027D880B5|nr:ATP-binding protein [Streptomyces sp. V4I23]